MSGMADCRVNCFMHFHRVSCMIQSLPCVATKFFTALLVECTAEEKEPYEAKARADKKRYKDEISGYKNPQPMNVDSGNESDSA